MDNERLKEACNKIKIIKDNLPAKIYPEMVSIKAKIPFKVLTLRELLIHRVGDLGDAACELYANSKVVPAIIITRALMETVAVMYYLYNIVNKAVISKSLKGFNDKIMCMLMGIRSGNSKTKPIHIMDCIRELNKWFEHFLEEYDNLSDIAHPNWFGLFGYYGKVKKEEMEIILGEGIRKVEAPFVMGVTGLSTAIEIFINFYDKIADVLPDFITLCETSLINEVSDLKTK